MNAQKYTPLDQITPGNVGKLTKVWDYHTGDMSDGTDGLPETVWSATPIFANDTLYLGTPFYKVIAMEPDTGRVRWTFDSNSALEPLPQPALKNRGVAYWETREPVPGKICQKIVYLGTMDAQLFALDADEAQAGGSGNESGFYPQQGAPYGELVALGMSQQYGFFMPESMGSPTIGGPVVTKSGLIFIGATMDARVRAFDIGTGKELWSDQMQAPVVANPAVFRYKGREYVAFVSGGNTIMKDQVGDQVAVYALPE